MTSVEMATKLKEWGWRKIKVWPHGLVDLDEWAQQPYAKEKTWVADCALGAIWPTGLDGHAAYYWTFWCRR